MKVFMIAMTGAGAEVLNAPVFASETEMREYLVATAARSYCDDSLGRRERTPAEQCAALADAYEVGNTPNGLYAAAIRWAAETGRGEWWIGYRETCHVDHQGRSISPNPVGRVIDKAFAKTVRP